MATTAAQVQTAYKAINRVDLNAATAQALADAINNGSTSLDAYIAQQIDAVAATTQAAVAISAFVTGLTPTAEKLDQLAEMAKAQFASYTAMGVGNPKLGAYEAFGKDFSATAEFEAKYGALDGADFINTVYAGVFGRLPNAAQLEALQGQIDYFTKLYTDAGLDNAVAMAKGAVLGQIVGYAFVSDASADSTLDDLVVQALTAAANGDTSVYGAPLAPAGQILKLTTGEDNLTGTDADDTFEAALAAASGGLVSQQTLQGFDTLDGGDGDDTLNAELNGFDSLFGAANPTVTNIERYNFTVSADGAAGGLDLARASGYEVLQNINSRGDLTLNNVNLADGAAPALELTNVRGDTEVNFDSAVLEVAELNVTASNVGSAGRSADLRVDVDGGEIETLNLNVSNGVYLDLRGDANDIANLNITGADVLALRGFGFGDLETLDSTGYTGDLTLDVSASEVLVSVNTGAGNDSVLVGSAAVKDSLVVDMGEGENTLRVDDVNSDVELSGLDFTGGVANVQTLGIDDQVLLGANSSLDLTGFDANLSTVRFEEGLDGDGFELAVNGPNADLTLASTGSFEDVDLHTTGITNLSVEVTDGNLDIDQLSGLEADDADSKLETLNLVQTADPDTFSYSALDITSDATHDVSKLQSITSTATGNASVEVDASGADADVNSLTSVSVTSTDNDAELVLTGAAGIVFEPGVQQVQGLSLTNSAGVNPGGLPGLLTRVTSGQVTFASDLFPGGILTIPYATVTSILGNTAAAHTAQAIADVVAGLNAALGSVATASSNAAGQIIITWAEASDEQRPDINIVDALTTSAQGNISVSQNDAADVAGEAEIAMEPGTGFEALADVVVDAQGGNADVELTDVYGGDEGFVVNVNALDNAWIDLANTGATSVTVTAGGHVDIDVEGDTIGNNLLTNITVTSTTADITLADNLESFETLDALNVSDKLVADTSGADFGSLATGEFVKYVIGATSDGDEATVDVDFTGNVAREVYAFDGADIGEVVITDFTWGADPATGDRLDLSNFARSAGELVFTDDGADLIITDLNGGFADFGGYIKIVGAAGQGADIAQFNILYA